MGVSRGTSARSRHTTVWDTQSAREYLYLSMPLWASTARMAAARADGLANPERKSSSRCAPVLSVT